jgi:hypothetical protein
MTETQTLATTTNKTIDTPACPAGYIVTGCGHWVETFSMEIGELTRLGATQCRGQFSNENIFNQYDATVFAYCQRITGANKKGAAVLEVGPPVEENPEVLRAEDAMTLEQLQQMRQLYGRFSADQVQELAQEAEEDLYQLEQDEQYEAEYDEYEEYEYEYDEY